jgi:tetratricopeptide (TPR) repeat protein
MSLRSSGLRRMAAAMAVAGALLSGCATEEGQSSSTGGVTTNAPPLPSPGTTVPGVGTYIPPTATQPPLTTQSYPHTIQDTNASKAVLSLYKQAQDARAAGHADQAEALLERALHIESRNPFVWQALAGAHMDLNQPDQAESAAQKSTSLARGNPYIEAGNWRLIASARQARGDAGGAMQAQARADEIARALSTN